MRSSHAYRITVTLLGVGLGACSAGRVAVETSPQPAPVPRTDSAYIAKARADSARYPYTAADVHFMTGMIGHHAQAIAMATWAPTHDASPAIRRLAERVINAQQDEIVIMQQWLRDRLQPVPVAQTTGMHAGMHHEHGAMMPGMLTDEQMKQLDQARGTEFDRLFLTFMIQHHRGAVTMVQTLMGTSGGAQDETVFKFAADVNVDQSTEIARMELMLNALKP